MSLPKSKTHPENEICGYYRANFPIWLYSNPVFISLFWKKLMALLPEMKSLPALFLDSVHNLFIVYSA